MSDDREVRFEERRAFDVYTGPDGPRHGFVIEHADGEWLAVGIANETSSRDDVLVWLGLHYTVRDAFKAVIENESPVLRPR